MTAMFLILCDCSKLSPPKACTEWLPTKLSRISQKSCPPFPLTCYAQILVMAEKEPLLVQSAELSPSASVILRLIRGLLLIQMCFTQENAVATSLQNTVKAAMSTILSAFHFLSDVMLSLAVRVIELLASGE